MLSLRIHGNGPTEAPNNLITRVKRIAFGFTRFRNYSDDAPAWSKPGRGDP